MEWLTWVHGKASSGMPGDLKPGDEVRVWYKIQEQDNKERLGQFEGIVIRCRGSGPSKTFTVRRVTYGEGVERIFPVDAKTVARVEILRRGQVRRSRLYFLRRMIGKSRLVSTDVSVGVRQSQAPTSGTRGREAELAAPAPAAVTGAPPAPTGEGSGSATHSS